MVIVAAQFAVRDRSARTRCVNEAPGAGIDADVVDAARVDMEKNQIPGRKLPGRDRTSGVLLLTRSAGNREAHPRVHVQRQSAAIEAR